MKSIPAKKLINQCRSGQAIIYDVRGFDEYLVGHILASKSLPLDELHWRYDKPPRNKTVRLVCECGNRLAKAQRELEKVGYQNVVNVAVGSGNTTKRTVRSSKRCALSPCQDRYRPRMVFLFLLGLCLAHCQRSS